MYIAVCDDQTEELKDLTELIGAMYEELPAPKPKKRRQALQEREK